MVKINSIDPVTAYEWLSNDEAVLIDVREPEEYREVHIKGSHLIPLQTVCEATLPKNIGGRKIIVHCKLGKRGCTACEKLLSENNQMDIYNLTGGITEWENAGLPVKK